MNSTAKLVSALMCVCLLLPKPARAQTALPSPLPPIKTVFLIVEENQNWSAITASVAPYINKTLLPIAAHAKQYYNPPGLHPSLANYIWLEAGSNLEIGGIDDPTVNHRDTPDHLVTYLQKAGISWKAYAEDIDGKTCPLTVIHEYTPRHNPFVYFDDVTGGNDPANAYCIAHIRPYKELQADLQNNTVARYNFLIPNVCNDGHDCGVARMDQWLSVEAPKILASTAYKDGGALLITWDEGSESISDGPIGMIVLSPFGKKNYSNSIYYTHSSTLRTLQEIFGVGPLLRDAANATDLSDLFVPKSAAISINEAGIVNSASYSVDSPAVAPGSIVVLFGRNLTDGRSCVPPECGPVYSIQGLSTSLHGTTVLVDGIPAPLFYVMPTQLGFQVPFELSGSAMVQVSANGQSSLLAKLPLAPAAPGIFTVSADGKNGGVITHANGELITPNNPAHPEEAVVLYATGFGQVTPGVGTGMRPAEAASTAAPAQVTIDGITVTPDYAGLSGCCVGLNQMNFQLPASVRSGTDIPLTISIGDAVSNTVTIAIQ